MMWMFTSRLSIQLEVCALFQSLVTPFIDIVTKDVNLVEEEVDLLHYVC